jgi:hypothetical protein
MRDYQAITIWQPWASLIAIGAKTLEFRSWAPPNYLWGSRIAIHAGARPVKIDEVKALLMKLNSSNAAETGIKPFIAIPFLEKCLMAVGSLPRSCVVCTATLGRPIRDAELSHRLGVNLVNDSDRDEHTNYGWPLSEIRQKLPPEPATGRQGFWTWRMFDA